jgi:cation transport regulator ChaC
MAGIALFAYGSLVDPASAAATIGREVASCGWVRLRGFRRRWSTCRDNLASEKTFALGDGSIPAWCLGLNVEPCTGTAGPNGVLFVVTEEELERLDWRELRYDRIEVTPAVEPLPELVGPVFAYVAKPERYAASPPDGAIVIASYVRAVEAAFAALGPDELDRYRRTTETPPVPVVEATLMRDAIPPGNPRRW